MQVLTSSQIHQWDAYTIEHEPIASIDLMERAATCCVEWFIDQQFPETDIRIFCGKGNNGGDGLAIARLLLDKGYRPTIYIIEFGAKGTDDFQANLQRLHQQTTDIHFLQDASFFPSINKTDIIIDALFGVGLNRPLQSLSAELVEHINGSAATVISIDVPSGMAADSSSKGNAIIKANHTLTFQLVKLCFLVPENAAYFGKLTVLDIGLAQRFLKTIGTTFELSAEKDIAALIRPRGQFSHKGNFGHALLICGNTGRMGAAILASRACLRTGTGLLTVNVPGTERFILQTAVPEAMLLSREDKLEKETQFATIGIGPALGTDGLSAQLLHKALTNFNKPMLIDADAITLLAADQDWWKLIPSGSILTPHPKEFDRIFGESDNDIERVNKAIDLSLKYPFVIVLKNHHTLIAANGKGWFNTTGNAGLAKGGSGDVLSGIITSLLAQGYQSVNAARIGVFLHGLAADIALKEQSMESMMASDVIDHIGKAFYRLSKNNSQV